MLNRFLPPLVLCALALSACKPAPTPAPEAAAPVLKDGQLRFPAGHPQLALLGVAQAAPGKAIGVDLPARLVWNEERTQRIYPAFAGRVMAIHADVGQTVRAGSVLAQLASPDFGAAQADTAKAEVDVRLTHKALARQRELFGAGIVARKDLEQSEADAARAQAEAARAQARTRLYGGASGVNQQLALAAGITGVVVERNLNPGQEVRPDQSGPGVPALFVVTDPTSLWVQIDAREAEVGALRPGAVFELSTPALPGQKFEGTVVAASDFIDSASRTIKVRGSVPNPDRRLKAEMLATARFERIVSSGVVVPTTAVLLSGTTHTVYLQVQPGVFEPREVQIGYEGPKEVVVSRGLEVGEQVVSDNVMLLEHQFKNATENAPAPVHTASSASKSVASQNTAGASAVPK